eukprot:sb/3469237/
MRVLLVTLALVALTAAANNTAWWAHLQNYRNNPKIDFPEPQDHVSGDDEGGPGLRVVHKSGSKGVPSVVHLNPHQGVGELPTHGVKEPNSHRQGASNPNGNYGYQGNNQHKSNVVSSRGSSQKMSSSHGSNMKSVVQSGNMHGRDRSSGRSSSSRGGRGRGSSNWWSSRGRSMSRGRRNNRNMSSSKRNSGKTHHSNFGINAGQGSSNHGNNLGVGNQGNSKSASHANKHGSHGL